MSSNINVGKSVMGIPLKVEILGSSARKLHIYSGIHGDEPEGVDFLTKFWSEELLRAPLKALTILCFKEVNPDGLKALTRVNANGVDLNRNFPSNNWVSISENKKNFPGLKPGSEPETKSILSLIDSHPPIAIISIHTWIPQVNFDGPAKLIAEKMSEVNGYPLTEHIGYPTPGSLGAYAGHDKKIPVITLELPEHRNISESWEKNSAALWAAIKFLERYEGRENTHSS